MRGVISTFEIVASLIGVIGLVVAAVVMFIVIYIGVINRKKQIGMVFGDLLGSIVANSTLVLGITCLISPIVLDGGFKVYFWATIAFLVLFFFFWFFVRTKKKLERWEGVVLLILYLIFIIFEFWRVTQNPAEAFFSQPLNH